MKSAFSVGFRPYEGTPWMGGARALSATGNGGTATSAATLSASERDAVLSRISDGTEIRNEIAAWWDATPNAREILGASMAAYSQALTEAVTLEGTVRTIKERLALPGASSWILKDSERQDLDAWSAAVSKLSEIVLGTPSAEQTSSSESVLAAVGIGLAAFGLAVIV